MVVLRSVESGCVVIEGRVNGQKIVTEAYMPVRKRLMDEAGVMLVYYDEGADVTRFCIDVASNGFDGNFLARVRKWLQGRLDKGKAVDMRTLTSRYGKKKAGYMKLGVVDGVVRVSIDSKKIHEDVLEEATDGFVDNLMRLYDGETPEEMAEEMPFDLGVIAPTMA